MSTTPTAEPRLAHFPVPFFASVLGLSGLTTALHAAGWTTASFAALALTTAVFVALAAIYALKALRHPSRPSRFAEWQHPVKLAFFPAVSISLLLIATALAPTAPNVARGGGWWGRWPSAGR